MTLATLTVAILSLWVLAGLAGAALLATRWGRAAPARRRVGFRLVAAALPVVLLAAGREIQLRWLVDRSDAVTGRATAALWAEKHITPFLNREGFRERELPAPSPLPPAPLPGRVVVLGDSFAFGQGVVDAADRLGDRLGSLLRASVPEADVWTLAKPGWGTRKEIEALAELGPRLAPRVVVVAYYKNDIEDHVPFAAGGSGPPGPLRWVIRKSFAANDVYWSVRTALRVRREVGDKPVRQAYDDPSVWGPHAADLVELFRLVRAMDAEPVLLIIPALTALPPWSGEEGEALDRLVQTGYGWWGAQAKVRALAEGEGVPVVDPVEAFVRAGTEQVVVSGHDAHANPRGHEILARETLPVVAAILARPPAPRAAAGGL